MTPLGYASDRLKVVEHERKDLLEEKDKKEEQFRCPEEERKVMIEIERKAHQEAQDLQVDGGNNSPPLIHPKTQ